MILLKAGSQDSAFFIKNFQNQAIFMLFNR